MSRFNVEFFIVDLIPLYPRTYSTAALIELQLNSSDASILYGGAERYWLKVNITESGDVDATITVVNKTPTRFLPSFLLSLKPSYIVFALQCQPVTHLQSHINCLNTS